jgi:2-(1,2-epoxy-1,2-dihydrophenyl)acetyl-CoA isomerase
MVTEGGVRVERVGPMAELVLDRPQVLNSFDEPMVAAMHEALDEVADARTILIRGEGRGFSAGRDLTGAEPLTEDAAAILEQTFNPLIARIADLPVPTVAAVHGACLGVGFGVAMACDLVLAARRSKIGSPFANIGAVLDSGGHYALVHRIGPHRALELIYTGRLLYGDEAAAWGLVNRAVDDDALVDEARALATQIAAGPVAAFGRSKQIVRRVADGALPFTGVLDAEARAQGESAGTAEYVEGFTAFAQKRSPDFLA